MTARKMEAVRLEELKSLLFDSGWFRQSEGHELLDEIDRAWEEIEKLHGRLAHAQETANKLYCAASAIGTVVESTPFDLHRATHEQKRSLRKAFIGALGALDVAVKAFGTHEWHAEIQRRDELDKCLSEVTKDRDEARTSERAALAERECLANILCAVLPVALRVVESGGDAADVIELGGVLVGMDAQMDVLRTERDALARTVDPSAAVRDTAKVALGEAEAREWAAGIVRSVPIDDLVRAGLASEDPAVTFEELEADHDLESLRKAHERARDVILSAILSASRGVIPPEVQLACDECAAAATKRGTTGAFCDLHADACSHAIGPEVRPAEHAGADACPACTSVLGSASACAISHDFRPGAYNGVLPEWHRAQIDRRIAAGERVTWAEAQLFERAEKKENTAS